LTPVEKVSDENEKEIAMQIKRDEPKGEHDKQKASRAKPEDLR
jgi:hypothetical protein